ncbi:unnamed protein product [Schistocephalus solidus]|uniref:Uncharacterized protein n=1 Tax=Schistocephalus solidus TaxID=70667 RepID=A0A183T981_SCHSO|nr:unnamed protein product [Schistocephalus solidus]
MIRRLPSHATLVRGWFTLKAISTDSRTYPRLHTLVVSFLPTVPPQKSQSPTKKKDRTASVGGFRAGVGGVVGGVSTRTASHSLPSLSSLVTSTAVGQTTPVTTSDQPKKANSPETPSKDLISFNDWPNVSLLLASQVGSRVYRQRRFKIIGWTLGRSCARLFSICPPPHHQHHHLFHLHRHHPGLLMGRAHCFRFGKRAGTRRKLTVGWITLKRTAVCNICPLHVEQAFEISLSPLQPWTRMCAILLWYNPECPYVASRLESTLDNPPFMVFLAFARSHRRRNGFDSLKSSPAPSLPGRGDAFDGFSCCLLLISSFQRQDDAQLFGFTLPARPRIEETALC